jgi:hypothetical protein
MGCTVIISNLSHGVRYTVKIVIFISYFTVIFTTENGPVIWQADIIFICPCRCLEKVCTTLDTCSGFHSVFFIMNLLESC